MDSQKTYYAVKNYLDGTYAWCNISGIVIFSETPMLLEKETAEDLSDRLSSWKGVNPVMMKCNVVLEVV